VRVAAHRCRVPGRGSLVNRAEKTIIAQLKKELQATTTRQQKQIEALTTGLQKVSDQLEQAKLHRSRFRTVNKGCRDCTVTSLAVARVFVRLDSMPVYAFRNLLA
jgi:hypothetical protein